MVVGDRERERRIVEVHREKEGERDRVSMRMSIRKNVRERMRMN